MAPKQAKGSSGPVNANPMYSIQGVQGDGYINADKNGYSFFGEFFDRGLQEQARSTKYYRELVSKRGRYASDALGNWLDASTQSSEAEEVRRLRNDMNDNFADMVKTLKDGQDLRTDQMEKMGKSITDALTAGKSGKRGKSSGSASSSGGGGDNGGEEENGQKSQDDINRFIGQQVSDWQKSWRSQQDHMSKGEAVLAICLEQVLNVAKQIETQVRNGRKDAANLYEANVANAVSRGVTTKGQLATETTNIGAQLMADGLYADIKVNDIYKGYLDLVNKGYSNNDAEALAYSDAITKKIAPYLDTQTTAFKDLQNAFGQTFLVQIQGINNYVQEIAGSAKVFEANINNIITSLEPIQLWAETQMWGENELAALDYLVENNGMTQAQAANLISSALKVTTNQYGSITGGTTAEKVAVATGQTDFGSAITSLLRTATSGGSSNQVAQGAFFQNMGVSGFMSENSDTSSVWSGYLTGLTKAQNSGTSASEKTLENYEALQSEQLSSTKEIHETLFNNTGSMLAFLQDFAPEVTERLDDMLSTERWIGGITSMIAIAQYKEMLANAANGIIQAVTGFAGQGAAAGLAGIGTAAASTGGIGAGIVAGGLAVGGTIAGIVGLRSLIKNNRLNDSKFESINSYDVGTDYVNQDQLALIHEGEAVLTPEENKAYQSGKKSGVDLTNSLVGSTITIKVEQEEKNDKLIRELRETTEKLIYAIKTYNKSERTFTYDSNTVNLRDESDE